MNPSLLLRPPLVWIALAEAVLMVVLGVVAWHVWQDRLASAGPPVAWSPASPRATPDDRQPPPSPPAVATPPAPRVGPTPGLRADPEFLSGQLSELNRVEAAFAELEWRVTRAIIDAIRRYLEGVVLPSVERSERAHR